MFRLLLPFLVLFWVEIPQSNKKVKHDLFAIQSTIRISLISLHVNNYSKYVWFPYRLWMSNQILLTSSMFSVTNDDDSLSEIFSLNMLSFHFARNVYLTHTFHFFYSKRLTLTNRSAECLWIFYWNTCTAWTVNLSMYMRDMRYTLSLSLSFSLFLSYPLTVYSSLFSSVSLIV